MTDRRSFLTVSTIFLAFAHAASAAGTSDEQPLISVPISLTFQPLAAPTESPPAQSDSPGAASARSVEEPSGTPRPETSTSDGRSRAFGRAGSRWWTIQLTYASDFEDANQFTVSGMFSEFLADEFEFGVEVGLWYINQPGDDTGAVSGSMVFRWHFCHAPDFSWTVFGEAGIGIMGAFDTVPDGGTGFNFLPRLGLGATFALDEPIDGECRGSRLLVGAGWQHISNGRILGDDSNPSRDSLMVYTALIIPF